MSSKSVTKLARGYDIQILDTASEDIKNLGIPKQVALKPIDFEGLKCKPSVAIGDVVKAGSELGFDKNHEEIKVTAPASGKVIQINRGHRRIITEFVIETDNKNESLKFDIPEKLNRQKALELLLNSGLFLLIKQRPFNIIADPEILPRDIFISALNSRPMAPDLSILMEGNENFFQKGLEVLGMLTSGQVHLSGSPEQQKMLEAYSSCEVHLFEGKHPAGNVGVQIHHIKPILNHEDVVWTLSVQSVILMGKFFVKGLYDNEILVKVSGENANDKRYFRTLIGANIANFVQAKPDSRIISGDILTGRQIPDDGYLGFFDNMISVIPEAKGHEFIGWISPGVNKLSVSRSFLSTLLPINKFFSLSTKKHGSERAFVASGIYEKVLPMDILPVYLMKAIIVKDIEEMEQLGIYELVEEDVALCEYICPSKIQWQEILREGLNLIQKEG